jgi:hypothetical protein
MEGLHEVDPSGDLLITLRNPGAPFADLANEESSDTAWFYLQLAGKDRKKKKKKGKRGTPPARYSPPMAFRW